MAIINVLVSSVLPVASKASCLSFVAVLVIAHYCFVLFLWKKKFDIYSYCLNLYLLVTKTLHFKGNEDYQHSTKFVIKQFDRNGMELN